MGGGRDGGWEGGPAEMSGHLQLAPPHPVCVSQLLPRPSAPSGARPLPAAAARGARPRTCCVSAKGARPSPPAASFSSAPGPASPAVSITEGRSSAGCGASSAWRVQEGRGCKGRHQQPLAVAPATAAPHRPATPVANSQAHTHTRARPLTRARQQRAQPKARPTPGQAKPPLARLTRARQQRAQPVLGGGGLQVVPHDAAAPLLQPRHVRVEGGAQRGVEGDVRPQALVACSGGVGGGETGRPVAGSERWRVLDQGWLGCEGLQGPGQPGVAAPPAGSPARARTRAALRRRLLRRDVVGALHAGGQARAGGVQQRAQRVARSAARQLLRRLGHAAAVAAGPGVEGSEVWRGA